jgi:hypothetical protein
VTLLGNVFFPPADYRRTALSTFVWWESRRPMFNVVVGGAGLVTLGVVRLIAFLPPGLPFMFDWRPIAVYALLANVCYTFGWGGEVLLQRLMRGRAPSIGPALFRQGVAFSIGLTLLPILLASFAWVARTGLWLVGR